MVNDLVATGFDYSSVAEQHRDEVRGAASRIRLSMTRTAYEIVEIGRELIAVKGRIGHGTFIAWIEAEFAMGRASAWRFMSVAERFEGKCLTVEHLPPSVLYELAAPSTPDEVVEVVVERAKAGVPVAVDDIKALKAEFKLEMDALKAKTKDAKSFVAAAEQQIADLQKGQRELLDERDLLQYQLDRKTEASVDADHKRQLMAIWGQCSGAVKTWFLEQGGLNAA